jgi:hypothetical protein
MENYSTYDEALAATIEDKKDGCQEALRQLFFAAQDMGLSPSDCHDYAVSLHAQNGHNVGTEDDRRYDVRKFNKNYPDDEAVVELLLESAQKGVAKLGEVVEATILGLYWKYREWGITRFSALRYAQEEAEDILEELHPMTLEEALHEIDEYDAPEEMKPQFKNAVLQAIEELQVSPRDALEKAIAAWEIMKGLLGSLGADANSIF